VRLLKFLAGAALLPLCVAATASLGAVIGQLRLPVEGDIPLKAWWLAGGFALWILLFFGMPRPMRTYVLAHELTHALWGVAMGARVSKLRVNATGGSVTLSKSNVLITLAPYFFPFYTMLAIAAYCALWPFLDLRPYEPFWLGLIGLTWAFHLTFTATVLLQRQPDIAEHGRLFSYVVIYALNVLGIGLWIVSVSSPTLAFFSERVLAETAAAYAWTWEHARDAWGWVRLRL
jgi:hypothetical protein